MKKNNIKKIFFEISLLLLLFIFNNIFISSTLFIFKISISEVNSIISFVLTMVLYILYSLKNKTNYKQMLICLLSFISILSLSIYISSITYDTSWDGNSYHKTAVGVLKNGWNPVYENIEEFNKSNYNKEKVNGTHDIWNNHYAKGAWIYAANIHSLTNNIESGKSINIIVLFAVLLIVISYCLRKSNFWKSLIISLLVTMNPVSLSQIFTFYNDGLIYGFIVILITILLMLVEEKENNTLYCIIITIILPILINIKFTGFAYGGITTFFFYVYIMLNSKMRKEKIKHLTIAGIISVLLGVGLLGYSTYIKNTINNGHPFYPLFGENKVDIMTTNQPKEFGNMNRIKKFIYSNFSESNNITYFQDENVSLKIPFTYSEKELGYLTIPDLRIGGFGVLFGGILLLSSVVIIIGMYFMFFKDKKIFYKLLTILLMIIALILILDESWWARYLPQIYIIPFIAVYLLESFRKKKINRLISAFIIISLFVNIIIFARYNFGPKFENYSNINKELLVKETEEIYVYTESFNGAVFNLYDKGYKINIVSDIEKIDTNKYTKKKIYNDMLTIFTEKKTEKKNLNKIKGVTK